MEFLAFSIDPNWTSLMVPKGSLAVDGVSLTLVDVEPNGFSVMLIPPHVGRDDPGRIAGREPGKHRKRTCLLGMWRS